MRKAEQKFWDCLKRAAPSDFWLQRVENTLVAGMPDVYCAWDGGAAWIELKTPKAPARVETKLLGESLSQDQVNWHIKAKSLEIPTFIAIRVIGSNDPIFMKGSTPALIKIVSRRFLEEAAFARSYEQFFAKLKS